MGRAAFRGIDRGGFLLNAKKKKSQIIFQNKKQISTNLLIRANKQKRKIILQTQTKTKKQKQIAQHTKAITLFLFENQTPSGARGKRNVNIWPLCGIVPSQRGVWRLRSRRNQCAAGTVIVLGSSTPTPFPAVRRAEGLGAAGKDFRV